METVHSYFVFSWLKRELFWPISTKKSQQRQKENHFIFVNKQMFGKDYNQISFR